MRCISDAPCNSPTVTTNLRGKSIGFTCLHALQNLSRQKNLIIELTGWDSFGSPASLLGQALMGHEQQPDECNQHQLVEQEMRYHSVKHAKRAGVGSPKGGVEVKVQR
jgi:hypothetical protein